MSDEFCNRSALGGSQCELLKGHEGKHQRTWDNGHVFSWTDASQTKLMDEFDRTWWKR
jgi:hypothetical protein